MGQSLNCFPLHSLHGGIFGNESRFLHSMLKNFVYVMFPLRWFSLARRPLCLCAWRLDGVAVFDERRSREYYHGGGEVKDARFGSHRCEKVSIVVSTVLASATTRTPSRVCHGPRPQGILLRTGRWQRRCHESHWMWRDLGPFRRGCLRHGGRNKQRGRVRERGGTGNISETDNGASASKLQSSSSTPRTPLGCLKTVYLRTVSQPS